MMNSEEILSRAKARLPDPSCHREDLVYILVGFKQVIFEKMHRGEQAVGWRYLGMGDHRLIAELVSKAGSFPDY
jgi:hypothetical protein